MRIRFAIFVLLGSLSWAAPAFGQVPTHAQLEHFEKKIRPLFATHCVECHGDSGKKVKGALRLTSREDLLKGGDTGSAIVPGDPEKSLLIKGVRYKSESLKMPPKGRLSDAEIADLETWVRAGAVWPSTALAKVHQPPKGQLFTDEQKRFWAFQPIVEPTVPPVRNSAWVTSPLDAFILSKLEANQLTPAAATDKRTWIRRVTFNLTGLPPTPHEIDAFLKDDSPLAFEKVVDRLLAAPAYGERWGRHWLDVARYADSNGLDENTAFGNAFRYRDYVVRAFNEDKPYNVFVMEQLAGDLMPDAATNPDRLTATGFLVLGPKILAEPDKQKMKLDIADEQLDTIGKAFMGLTLGCARCHDHKFDPIPTRDYYGLLSIFTSTRSMKSLATVAQAYERLLPNLEPLEKKQQRDRQIAQVQADLEKATQQLREKILADARRKTADYLLATADASEPSEGVSRMAMAPQGKLPDAIVLQAEKFTGGNADRDTESYGKGIGVIISYNPTHNKAEYGITIPKNGSYDFEVRYAAAASRPVKISIDGKEVLPKVVAATTGGWNPDHQVWRYEGKLKLEEGRRKLTIEGHALLPHIDQFALIPSVEAKPKTKLARPSVGTMPAIAVQRSLVPEILSSWSAYLRNRPETDTLFRPWLRLANLSDQDFATSAKPIIEQLRKDIALKNSPAFAILADPIPSSLREVANRYGMLFASTTMDGKIEPTLEPLRNLLRDSAGPVAFAGVLPTNPEKLYLAEMKRLTELNQQLDTLRRATPQPVMVLSVEEGAPYPQVKGDGKPRNLFVQIRGNYLSAGEEAPAIFPRILGGEQQTPIGSLNGKVDLPLIESNQTRYGSLRDRSGRLELAQWLTDSKHPLTARVMVNRIWQHHFGEGLVRSPDNFGKLGERPTHPELLDWLARRLIEDGWSMKKLHKRILLSSTYRMSTKYDPRAAEIDPDNRLLWRFHRRRLEAEAIRDSMLAIGGNLDRSIGGSFMRDGNFAYITNENSAITARYDTNRRSIYLPVIRNAVFDFFQTFDFVEPSVLNGKRASTVIAPQALYLLNSPVVKTQAAIFAESLLQSEGAEKERIRSAYVHAYGREPSEGELSQAVEFLRSCDLGLTSQEPDATKRRRAVWTAFCQVLFAGSEFIYVN